MTANPIDSAIVDNVNVSKSDTRGFVKDRLRQRFEDATEVRAASLSGQYGGIYVASLGVDFDVDTSDSTTGDDGVSCIIDADGNRFKPVADADPATNYLARHRLFGGI